MSAGETVTASAGRGGGAREHDLVLTGITGYAGWRVAEHVARHAPAGMRVGVAGRSRERVESARSRLPGGAARWPVLVADATDEADMAALASATRVVATSVGPYLRYGSALAAACARAGTHYADLTGEVPFMRRSIDDNDAAARESGARIVHASGFDSVPSDLGVWLLHRHAAETGAGGLTRVTAMLTQARGSAGGGTIDSLRVMMEEAERSREARALLADPHALDARGTDGAAVVPRSGPADSMALRWDPDLRRWLAPWVMASINSRVVRRSHSLLAATEGGPGYGERFQYREVVGVPGRVAGAPAAGAVTVATGVAMAVMAWRPARRAVDRFLPQPSQGPSERPLPRGRFRLDLVAETDSGRRLKATVGAALDPAAGATAVMLAESAFALAAGEGGGGPGVTTPALAYGDALAGRLRAQGFTLSAAG